VLLKEKNMNCKTANELKIISVLNNLGYNPKKESKNNATYISPFREERTASFRVNKQKNTWRDYGDNSGGTVIDFIIRLKSCSVTEALDFLSKEFSSFSFKKQKQKVKKEVEKTKIIAVHPIEHPALINYIESRKIPLNIALKFCKEVKYEFAGKLYFSIGLENKSFGWELRNKIFKNSTSPKDYTLIKNGKSILSVVEGMFDLLALLVLNPDFINSRDLLVLNSVNFLETAKSIFDKYEKVELNLDRDNAGFNATNKYVNKKNNITDMSFNYNGFKDYNDYLMNKN